MGLARMRIINAYLGVFHNTPPTCRVSPLPFYRGQRGLWHSDAERHSRKKMAVKRAVGLVLAPAASTRLIPVPIPDVSGGFLRSVAFISPIAPLPCLLLSACLLCLSASLPARPVCLLCQPSPIASFLHPSSAPSTLSSRQKVSSTGVARGFIGRPADISPRREPTFNDANVAFGNVGFFL